MTIPPLRTWVLALFSSLIILLIGYLLFERWGLFLGLILSLLWDYALLLFNHKSAVDHYKGKLLQGQDPWNLNELLRTYENKLRCPRIKLYLCEKEEPLCLISISHWQNPSVLISEGLIKRLNSLEIEALIALCVSSLKNRNTFTHYVLDRIALTWFSLSQFWERVLQPLNQFNILKQFCFMIAWFHWKIAFTKSLQAKSDLETYKTLTHGRSLATALWKIQGAIDTLSYPIPSPFLYQSVLGHSGSRRTAFQFIVPIEHRLQLLIGYYPI